MIKKYSLIFSILIICSTCYGQQSDMLGKIMQDYLKLKGKKPVNSIQIYLSKNDTVFNEAVGFVDGKKEKGRK